MCSARRAALASDFDKRARAEGAKREKKREESPPTVKPWAEFVRRRLWYLLAALFLYPLVKRYKRPLELRASARPGLKAARGTQKKGGENKWSTKSSLKSDSRSELLAIYDEMDKERESLNLHITLAIRASKNIET